MERNCIVFTVLNKNQLVTIDIFLELFRDIRRRNKEISLLLNSREFI